MLGQPCGPLIYQDEWKMTQRTPSMGSRVSWSRNRKGGNVGQGFCKEQKAGRAQRTGVPRKLLLGARTCCVGRGGQMAVGVIRGVPWKPYTKPSRPQDGRGDTEAGHSKS